MKVHTLTYVRSGAGLLELSTRNNLQYIDEAHFVLGTGTNSEKRMLTGLKREGLPVYVIEQGQDLHFPRLLESAISSLGEFASGDDIVLILETDDLLSANIRELSSNDTGGNAFSVPRHIAYCDAEHQSAADPAKLHLRQETRPSSVALGFHLQNSPGRLQTIDDPFHGHPAIYGPPKLAVSRQFITRVPVRSFEQFCSDTANAWLAVEGRSGVSSATASTAGSWLSQAKNLMVDTGDQLTEQTLWTWCEQRLAPTTNRTVAVVNGFRTWEKIETASPTNLLLSNAINAVDKYRASERSTRTELRREKLFRVHDVMSILLEDCQWFKTWVWKDRAAVFEIQWDGLTVAFDIFLTSDELSIQLVSRENKSIPGISDFLESHGIEEIKIPEKPGRYAIAAVPMERRDLSMNQIKAVARIIRPLALGMSA